MAQIELTLNDEALQKVLNGVEKALGHGQAIFREFSIYMRQATDNMFQFLGKGGTHRGVTWQGWADQYLQKTTGVTVPAWGGVPKVYGAGSVLGRKRPSGARVDQSSNLMQDWGTLRANAALTTYLGKDLLRMGPQGVSYAGEMQEMRPFLFFQIPKDANVLLQIAVKHLKRATR